MFAAFPPRRCLLPIATIIELGVNQIVHQLSNTLATGRRPTNSLLKNSFGSSFRGALRHGISLFVGFWRGGILYSVRDGVFRSLFQQTANCVQEWAQSQLRDA